MAVLEVNTGTKQNPEWRMLPLQRILPPDILALLDSESARKSDSAVTVLLFSLVQIDVAQSFTEFRLR